MLRCSTHGLAARPNSARSVVTRSGNGATGSVKEGQRVKIIKDIKIFHAPKHPEGLSIQGLEGLLVKNVAEYKSKILSANLPYKVELRIPLADGSTVKTLVHLADDEIAPA